MDRFFLILSVALSLIVFMPLYRLISGPTLYDRILGAGAVATKTMILILMLGLAFKRLDMFIDITLAYAILNFIGTIAIAKYLDTRGPH